MLLRKDTRNNLRLNTINLFMLALVMLSVSGCGATKATVNIEQEMDLSAIKHVYVQKSSDDEYSLDRLIARRFKKNGINAGVRYDDKSMIDAVVTYEAQWYWDLKMVLGELTVTIRDKDSNVPIASSNLSHVGLFRTMNTRKIVDEVVNSIFVRKQSAL